jgi:hypothetical protein
MKNKSNKSNIFSVISLFIFNLDEFDENKFKFYNMSFTKCVLKK